MPGLRVWLGLLVILVGLGSEVGEASPRTALVIGNSAYDSRLPNPERDARAVASKLKSLGFDVILETDANYDRMLLATDKFTRTLSQKRGLGLFYYAGHGIQANGENYLIPVKAKIDMEVQLKSRTLSLQSVLEQMGAAGNGLNIAIIDACRDNPLSRSWSRSGQRGLAPPGETADGTLVIFATGAGQTAEDGNGNNSPFTQALVQHLGDQIPISQLFNQVGKSVRDMTGGKQRPHLVSSLYEPILLASGSIEQYSPPVTPAAPTPSVSTPSVSTPSGLTKLEIKSEPAGATLFLDGNYVGGLPQSLTLPAGKVVTLEARLSGYETVRQPTTIPNTGSKQVTLMLDRIENPSYSAPASSSYSGSSDAGSAGDTWTNSLGMEFVTIPSGSFQMGSNTGQSDEKPVHTVQIRKSFRLMTTEVTQGQWQAMMGSNPSRFTSCGSNCPVENVSWDDIQTFIQKLNAQTGETYRLPSEAEWEYAARAGTRTDYSWGNGIGSGNANCDGCGSRWDNKSTAPVRSFAPNAWGLYDMHGNVWEWVEDWYHDSYSGHPGTESAWTSGDRDYGVLRGGSWADLPVLLRAAFRFWDVPSARILFNGFRLVQGR